MRNRIKSLFFVLLALLCVGLFSAETAAPLYAASGSFDVTPRLVLSAVKTIATDERPVTITNVTGGTIQINALSIDNARFSVVGSSTPFSIPANGSHNVTIRYSPNAEGVDVGTLTVTGSGGSESVHLRGLGTDGTGGNNEPSLQLIFDAWGLPVATGDNVPATTAIHSNPAIASQGMLVGSDEISQMAFKQANPGQPVTMQVLAIYGVNNTPDVRVGIYTPGNPADKTELFTIDCCGAQTLAPAIDTGSLNFNRAGNFSFYSQWPGFSNRVVYQEAYLNEWDTTARNRYKYRIYPMPGETNAYIYAVEEYHEGFDYNDIVVVVRNVAPATPVGGAPGIIFENRAWQTLNALNVSGTGWMNRWLAFSKLRDPAPPDKNLRVHDTATLRIHNTGTSPITVSSIAFDDPSNWKANVGTPFNIPVNGHQDVPVQYIEVSSYSGARFGKMFITSNAPNEPFATINLGAGFQQKMEGLDELQAQFMVDSFGFKTIIGRIPAGSYFPAGEEVMSKYWSRADGSEPIYIRQLAAFHGCCSAEDTVRTRQQTTNTILAEFKHDKQDGQSYLPLKSGVNHVGEMTLNPPTSTKFYFEVSGFQSCNPDNSATCSSENRHGLRIWPARDPQGKFIPNAYLFSMDFVGNPSVNFDYNDNVYLVTNIVPDRHAMPDLVTKLNANTPAVTTGGTAVFRFDVRNIRPFAANSVDFTITLPANATYVSHTNAQCSRNNLQINCNFGSNFVNNDQTVFVTVQATGGSSLTISNTLTTSSSEIGGISNNNASMSIPVLSAPQAHNDLYAAQPDAPLTVASFGGVLTNDLYVTSLTSSLYSGPRNGTVSLNADGSFVYTPSAGFNGEDSFTYLVSGTDASADLGTVNITVGSGGPVNLLADGSFEAKQNGIDTDWKIRNASKDKSKCSKPTKSAVAYDGECAFAFSGGAGENSKISQTIRSDALIAGQTLALTGMFKAEALPEGAAQVRVKVVYADGTKDKQTFDLNGGSYDYTAFAENIAITGAVKKVKFNIVFSGDSGSLWADLLTASVGGAGSISTGDAGFGTSDTLDLPEAVPGFGSNQP